MKERKGEGRKGGKTEGWEGGLNGKRTDKGEGRNV